MNSWILSQLRFVDKDKSSTMDKAECQHLLVNSLNVQLAEDVFENLFNVEVISNLLRTNFIFLRLQIKMRMGI